MTNDQNKTPYQKAKEHLEAIFFSLLLTVAALFLDFYKDTEGVWNTYSYEGPNK